MDDKRIPIRLDNYKPLRELVFEGLRESILDGRLEPGQRLMEIQLAEQMGVSRTPVREAIRKLELEGLVVMIPRKGAYVADMSMKDISEVFEIRSALEGLAAELAAERISENELERLERYLYEIAEAIENNDLDRCIEVDTGFHEELFSASHNAKLEQMISNLREQIQRFRIQSLARPGRMETALQEHRALVEAIGQRDSELARQLAQEHIESAENALISCIQVSARQQRRLKRE